MGIKTDTLQKNTAPKAADTLLMAASAGGTAQLTLANLAKFLVEQDNAVKTALSNKAALSAQQTVEKTDVTSRTVEVAAAELPAFITSLPRLVTESLTIKVTSGTVPGNVAVSRFYGPGSLSIAAEDGAEVVLSHAMSISSCQIGVGLTGLRFLNANSAEVILTISGSHAVMSNCVINGNHLISYNYGCLARDGGSVYAINCDITNCQYALGTQSAGIVSALNCTGSGNKVGCYVSYGGMAFLSGTTPDLMGGTANRKESGLIVKSNGTLV